LKQSPATDDQYDCDENGFLPAELPAGSRCQKHHHGHRQHETDMVNGPAEEHESDAQQNHRLPVEFADTLTVRLESGQGNHRAKHDQTNADPCREITGPHACGGAKRVILGDEDRQGSEGDEHETAPEIFLTRDFQLNSLLISETDTGTNLTPGPVCRPPCLSCRLDCGNTARTSFLTPVLSGLYDGTGLYTKHQAKQSFFGLIMMQRTIDFAPRAAPLRNSGFH